MNKMCSDVRIKPIKRQEQLNLIIVEGDDIIEISSEEVVISEGGECRRIQEEFILMYARKINDNNTIIQRHHRCFETDKM